MQKKYANDFAPDDFEPNEFSLAAPVYLAEEVDAKFKEYDDDNLALSQSVTKLGGRIAELEGWLDRLLPSWREAEARDYEEALVTSYRRQIAELEADLETLARSGCKVRTFNGERYVEIASSSTD